MKIPTRSFLVAALLVAAPFAFAAPKPAMSTGEGKVRQLLELTGASAMNTQIVDAMLKQPGIDPAFAARFKAEAAKDDLIPKLIPVYLKHLDEKDLDAAIAFYKSPAGRHMVAAQPMILQDSMAIGQQWGKEVAERAQSADSATPSEGPAPK